MLKALQLQGVKVGGAEVILGPGFLLSKSYQFFQFSDPNATKFMSEVFTPNAENSSQDGPALSEILLQEVENLETSERIKAFIQPNPPSTVLQCMICKKPGRNIEIRSNQFTRHTSGKYHMEQMKKFSILQTTS